MHRQKGMAVQKVNQEKTRQNTVTKEKKKEKRGHWGETVSS